MREQHATALTPAAIVRPALPAVDMIIWYGGRPLRIAKVCGEDAAAPVILEELAPAMNGDTPYAKGQYALWSLAGVMRAMGGRRG